MREKEKVVGRSERVLIGKRVNVKYRTGSGSWEHAIQKGGQGQVKL